MKNPGRKPTLREAFLAYRAGNVKVRPKLHGEAFAIFREAVKDVRGTIHQVFFGQPEHMSESGTPLNPTQIMTTNEVQPDTYDRSLEHAALRGGNSQEKERSR